MVRKLGARWSCTERWARGVWARGGGMGGTHLQRQSRSRGEVELNLLVVLGLSLPRQLPVQDAHGGGHLLTLAGSHLAGRHLAGRARLIFP